MEWPPKFYFDEDSRQWDMTWQPFLARVRFKPIKRSNEQRWKILSLAHGQVAMAA
jgi:hypothetical protein